MTNGHDSAFTNTPAFDEVGNPHVVGLTKRELFAAMAMQGILADPGADRGFSSNDALADAIGKYSVKYADALIAALNEEQA